MALNQAYDALMDLANVIGVSPQAISLNGELGIAFGSRGSGNANAHYELNNVVINLTENPPSYKHANIEINRLVCKVLAIRKRKLKIRS